MKHKPGTVAALSVGCDGNPWRDHSAVSSKTPKARGLFNFRGAAAGLETRGNVERQRRAYIISESRATANLIWLFIEKSHDCPADDSNQLHRTLGVTLKTAWFMRQMKRSSARSVRRQKARVAMLISTRCSRWSSAAARSARRTSMT